MNRSEADAVNILLSALTGTPRPGSTQGLPPDEDDVREAVALLASHAHQVNRCGWDGPAAALAVEQLYATGRETAARAEAGLTRMLADLDEGVIAWERSAARALVARCDGDELTIDGPDGQPWAADRPDEDDIDDELIVTHPSGRQAVARVSVRLIGGALS